MIEKEVTVEAVERLLIGRRSPTVLFAGFPSRKVRQWADERQRSWGLRNGEYLLMACIRMIYDVILFSIGGIHSFDFVLDNKRNIRKALRALMEHIDKKALDDAVDEIFRWCMVVAIKISNKISNALADILKVKTRWFAIMLQ